MKRLTNEQKLVKEAIEIIMNQMKKYVFDANSHLAFHGQLDWAKPGYEKYKRHQEIINYLEKIIEKQAELPINGGLW